MIRPVYIVANWKMHGLPSSSAALARSLGDAVPEHVRLVVCPPFLSVPAVHAVLTGRVDLGVQDVHWEDAGPFTGEVSAVMAAEYATWSLVGHSERRRDQGETDSIVGRKVARCLERGLRPILFLGETATQWVNGETESVVLRQLDRALEEVHDGERLRRALVLAYEPIWAVGSDDSPSPDEAAVVARALHDRLRATGRSQAGDHVPVLYGGSVDAANAAAYATHPDFDGVVVGRASLDPRQMASIIAACAVPRRSDRPT